MELEYDILSYFPTEIGEPRDRQIDILNSIEKAIEADYKYIVLKAGTGIGKSAIAATLANAIGSAFIVTGTKDLQRQYNKELPYPLLFGRGNFTCITNGFECDIGDAKTVELQIFKQINILDGIVKSKAKLGLS